MRATVSTTRADSVALIWILKYLVLNVYKLLSTLKRVHVRLGGGWLFKFLAHAEYSPPPAAAVEPTTKSSWDALLERNSWDALERNRWNALERN